MWQPAAQEARAQPLSDRPVSADGPMRWALAALAIFTVRTAPVSTAGTPSPPPRPAVLVITTGGTIASRAGDSTLSGGALLDGVPQVRQHARVQVEEFSRIGSSRMTPQHWLGLSQRVAAAFAADPGLRGIVVTHGTDTLEETAYFLDLTVAGPRPVVVVGAMRGADAVSADGPANLVAGVRVAASPEAAGAGVLVVLNDTIHAARDVRKLDDQRVHAFDAPGLGALGFVDEDAVVFRRRVWPETGAEARFDAAGLRELPRVEMVLDYPGLDPASVTPAAARGARGVVAVALAGGRMSPGMRAALPVLVEAGVSVVVASRVPGGRISGEPSVPGTVLARDLSPAKARVLLMLALTQTADPVAVRRLFDRS